MAKKRRKKSKLDWYYRAEWWRARRLIHLKDHPTCFICGTKAQLQVHHRLYTTLGAERDDDLVTLCKTHHTQVEEGVSAGQWDRFFGHFDLAQAIASGVFPPKRKKRKNRGLTRRRPRVRTKGGKPKKETP